MTVSFINPLEPLGSFFQSEDQSNDPSNEKLIFNRDPQLFNYIIKFYQNNQVEIPDHIPIDFIVDDTSSVFNRHGRIKVTSKEKVVIHGQSFIIKEAKSDGQE